MTLPQRMYLNPEIVLERNQEYMASSECRSCQHFDIIADWGDARICRKHQGLAGNLLARCADYEQKESKELLKDLFKANQ